MSAFGASAEGLPSRRVRTVVRVDNKSGRLVRTASVVAVPADRASKAPGSERLEQLIDQISGENGVEGPLVYSVIKAESNYNASAVSPKGAQGIMQLMPVTAKRFGVADLLDPQENIQGGVKYLKFLLDYYNGDYTKTVAAYNAGEGAVDRYNGVPPYDETTKYVRQVARNLSSARQKRTKTATGLGGAKALAETYQPIQASVGSDGKTYYHTP